MDGQLDEHIMDECENRCVDGQLASACVETMRDEYMMDEWENRCVDKWKDGCVDGHLDEWEKLLWLTTDDKWRMDTRRMDG